MTKRKTFRLTPKGLVLGPLIVLTAVFCCISIAVYLSDEIAFVSLPALLIACITFYAATILLLSKLGLSQVRELETLGTTDNLSRLPNRRALHLHIEEQSAASDEVALAIIDLDSFKQINDHYGHAVGDELIRRCSEILRSICEPEAKCYRLGGDEFAVVMAGEVAGTILEGMCRSLLETLTKPIAVQDRNLTIGASIGLSRHTTKDPVSSSELLRRSDVAMDMSKRGGKMRCTWFNANFDRRREAVRELDDELRTALAKGEFVLAYQPLVDADNGSIVAVESLLRWNRPDGQHIGPNVFIPVAEESGLINAIGLWVLRQAVSDAQNWGDLTLSVNISAAQLRNPEFPIQLGQILEESGFPPNQLELEITETCLVLDPIIAERTLDVIRGFGVNVALDDFGTGYASIGFLRQFRFEKLKLDRSLVVQAGEDEGSRAMMLSSIAVARALKMGVTAEGVETVEQADLVRTAGCDQIQGWLYYKALPADEISALLEQPNANSDTKTLKSNEAR
ncbi:MAG: EAL domain-containing protein [Erythrobacter sp.]|uniref:putative bifunctional diguanylate cyclase/phosphodiesterase n=1 Tax=Marinobacter alexandrii TaxID=2570351 RepID=UPI0032971BB0